MIGKNDGPDLNLIESTLQKMYVILQSHDSICVGVSGGSDSNIIVHMIATNFREFLPKIHFVFQNTGLEYKATLRHLSFMKERYGIDIEVVKGKSVVSACREYGVPIISKDFSDLIYYAQQGKDWAIRKINRTKQESPYALSKNKKALADYLLDGGMKVSDACCSVSKKSPYKKYLRSVRADLTITGERKCEGGVRAQKHKSCVEHGKIDKYMPLWFWNDDTKRFYKEQEGIVYSDCYEVYGFDRTGCVGCPFNSMMGRDLKIIKQYEPNLYNACMHVFGESYVLMDKFNIRRNKILDDEETEAVNERKRRRT